MGLGQKTLSGILWTSAGEIIVKFISPVSFLVLASILSPSDFGVVAIATTVLSFVNIVSDLGTGKVLVQLKCGPDEFKNYCTTAFWFNIVMGIVLFLIIFCFSDLISDYNNQPEAAPVVKVMSLQVIFTSMSIVQTAIMNREMNFKTLFFIRLITVAVPALVSIPVALLGGGLWAIVCGNLAGSFFHMAALWVYSSWKPNFAFYKDLLYNIFSKSLWSTLQQIVVWIPIAFDTYLLSNYLSSSALGLYTTSRQLFQSVSMLIMGPMLTVIFSSLSKIDDNKIFKSAALYAQKTLFSIASFMAIFVLFYSDIIAQVLFSDKWEGIGDVLAVIFILMGFETFYSIIVEALRSRGFFRELALNNLISVLISLPLVFYGAKTGLIAYTVIRCLSLYLCYFGVFYYSRRYFDITFWDCVKNSRYTIFSILMSFVSLYVISLFRDTYFYVYISIAYALIVLFFYTKEKESIKHLLKLFLHKK